jgi:hypothetical protein
LGRRSGGSGVGRRRLLGAALAAAVGWSALTTACGGDGGSGGTDVPPKCLAQPADATCTDPLYGFHNGQLAPTYDDIYTRTLKPTCAVEGCHSGPNPPNGLSFDDESASYDALQAKDFAGDAPRMTPKDLACGALIVRLETPGHSWSMPGGRHLDEPTLCVIRHWIANGAPR